MGFDAEVFVFDYQHYLNELVPVVHQLLLTGDTVPWLMTELQGTAEEWAYNNSDEEEPEINFNPAAFKGTDLQRYCTYLDPATLGLRDCDQYRNAVDVIPYNPPLACESTECPVRDRCPLHENQPEGDRRILSDTFAYVLITRYGLQSQFLGRSNNTNLYEPLLKKAGLADFNHPFMGLLARLRCRGAVLGYGEDELGLLGWLDPAEAGQFASYLDPLPLPRFEPTFEEMHAQQEQAQQRPSDLDSYRALSLAFLRTAAHIAAHQNRGLAWSVDLAFHIRKS